MPAISPVAVPLPGAKAPLPDIAVGATGRAALGLSVSAS